MNDKIAVTDADGVSRIHLDNEFNVSGENMVTFYLKTGGVVGNGSFCWDTDGHPWMPFIASSSHAVQISNVLRSRSHMVSFFILYFKKQLIG